MGDDKITESAGVLVVRWAGPPAAGALGVVVRDEKRKQYWRLVT